MKNKFSIKTASIFLFMVILSFGGLSWGEQSYKDSLYRANNYLHPVADYRPTSPKPAFWGSGPLEYCNSSLWGGVYNFVLRDSLAYLGMRNGLMILNISNPAEPSLVGQYYIADGGARDIKVANDFAYLALYDGALYIINISDPTSPQLAGKYITARSAYGVDIEDSLAYIAYGYSSEAIGLLILNISNPVNISFVADVPAEGAIGAMLKVDVENNYAYVVGDARLWIWDVSDPADPIFKLKLLEYFDPVDLIAKDTILYLADNSAFSPPFRSAFSIMNVADPVNPTVIWRDTLLFTNVCGIALIEDKAYVGCGEYGLQIYDMTDPFAPDSIGRFPTFDFTGKVRVADSVVFTIDWPYSTTFWGPLDMSDPTPGDFYSVNVADPYNPAYLGNYELMSNISGMVVSDRYIFALNDTYVDSDLQFIDKSCNNPVIRGSYNGPGDGEVGIVIGDTLYLAAGRGGLELIDISNPDSTYCIRSYASADASNSGVIDVKIKDSLAFIAGGGMSIRIYDITNPVDSHLFGFSISDAALELALYGDYLYIANRWNGVAIINVADPQNPIHIDQIGYVGQRSYHSLDIHNGRLYASGHLEVYDLSIDPENPTLLGEYDDGGDIFVYDNYAILGNRNGVMVIDVSDPANMFQTTQYNTPGVTYAVAADENYVYAAGGRSIIILSNQLPTDIEEHEPILLPEKFILNQNYPNPFNPTTTIKYSVPSRSHITLSIYNMLGQEVITLVDETKPVGTYMAYWDGKDNHGRKVATGIYFYQVKADSYTASKKMLLLK